MQRQAATPHPFPRKSKRQSGESDKPQTYLFHNKFALVPRANGHAL